MTISFFEPGDVPQPPDKVKIEHLTAAPHPDGWRVKVEVHVTPFQQRPNLEIVLVRLPDERQVASLSIVETMHPRMEFMMHVRGVDDPTGDYELRAMLYFRDTEEIEDASQPLPVEVKDTRQLAFSIGVNSELSDEELRDVLLQARVIAVVGHSDKPERTSYQIAQYLREAGYTVYPVNPTVDEIDGQTSYPSLADIPEPIDIVDVFRRSEHLAGIVEDAIAVGAGVVWAQLGVYDASAASHAQTNGLSMVMDRCIKVEHRRLLRNLDQ